MSETERFRQIIAQLDATALQNSSSLPAELRMHTDGEISVYYAPFEHVNRTARVALIGITPGLQQARNALLAYREALRRGASEGDALLTAKRAASFSGPMRGNLVALLDFLRVNEWLGIRSCASLFGADVGLVHFTSALRFPVLVNGENYSGRQPSLTRDHRLLRELHRRLPDELSLLDAPLLVPLGGAVESALDHLAEGGHLLGARILRGLPHPSGANSERIAYFLERKPATACSSRVDTAALDRARQSARSVVERLIEEATSARSPRAATMPQDPPPRPRPAAPRAFPGGDRSRGQPLENSASESLTGPHDAETPQRHHEDADARGSSPRPAFGRRPDGFPRLGPEMALRVTPAADDDTFVWVPVAKDRTFFGPHVRLRKKGYALGERGDRVYSDNFTDALNALRSMKVARWRRPSETSGVPGTVTAVGWVQLERRVVNSLTRT